MDDSNQNPPEWPGPPYPDESPAPSLAEGPENRSKNRSKPLIGNEATQFKRGKSGNPGGRPKKDPITSHLGIYGDKRTPAELMAKLAPSAMKVIGKRPTLDQLQAWVLMQRGLGGDMAAIREILNRREGRAPDTIRSGDNGFLDQIAGVLAMKPAQPGEVNEGVDDLPPEDLV